MKDIVIISTKDKPIVLTILAALFYTVAIILIGISFYNIQFSLDESVIKERINLFVLIVVFIFGGISFSQKRTMFFDLKKRKFKSQLSVGPIKIGKWQDLPPLNYISVFVIDSKSSFSINLWYDKNKHINIFTFFDKEKAFEIAFEIADQLNIKLLDATKQNNYKYLNMDKLKDKYKNISKEHNEG